MSKLIKNLAYGMMI